MIPASPRNAVKEAFAAGIITDGQVWIDMMLHRNLMSHTYDATALEGLLVSVQDRYVHAMAELYLLLKSK